MNKSLAYGRFKTRWWINIRNSYSMLMKPEGFVPPIIDVYSRIGFNSLFVWEGADDVRMIFHELKSHSPQEIYPPGSLTNQYSNCAWIGRDVNLLSIFIKFCNIGMGLPSLRIVINNCTCMTSYFSMSFDGDSEKTFCVTQEIFEGNHSFGGHCAKLISKPSN